MSNSTGSLIGLIIGIVGAAVVIKIIADAAKEKKYECSNCGHTVRKGISRCSNCRTPLRWA